MKHGRLCAFGVLSLSWLPMFLMLLVLGCQTASPGLPDQLVRGSALPSEEVTRHQPGWWSQLQSNWRSWFNSTANDTPAISTAASRPVQPDDVTPATAWHVLQQLRDEIERDRANPQD